MPLDNSTVTAFLGTQEKAVCPLACTRSEVAHLEFRNERVIGSAAWLVASLLKRRCLLKKHYFCLNNIDRGRSGF